MAYQFGLQVSERNPLPVTQVDGSGNPVGGASGSTPVTGTFTGTGQSAAFTPAIGRAIWATLSGTFVGTVIVERSVNGGTTWLPLTIGGASYGSFTAPAQEPVSQEDDTGATYRLRCTAYTSGTITYRLGHS